MKNKWDQSVIKKILYYIGEYRWGVVLSFLCAFVTVILTLYVPVLIGQAVDCIVSAGNVDFSKLFKILIKMAVVILSGSVVQWFMSYINNQITFLVVKDIRTKSFKKLEELPLQYIDAHQHGDILSRLITDIDQLADGLLMGFTQLFTGIITILGTLVFMFAIQPMIALVVIIITPLSLAAAGYIAKKSYFMFQKQSHTRGELTSLIDEMVGNQKIVRAFSQEKQVQEKFWSINERLGRYSLRATFFSSVTFPITRFINSLVYASVGVAGTVAAVNGLLTVGQITSFLSYANQYTKPFNEISGVVTELQNALASASRVFELMEEEPQIPDQMPLTALESVNGQVELRDVEFSYTDESPFIEGLNVNAVPGQKTALVGPTGCGKSTLINLLMRFYEIKGGVICVDGKDITGISRNSLRTSYGMVLQDTWLRTGTIRENIAYGKPNASEDEIIQAAKDAYADGFIRRLPFGYDTLVSEMGDNFSEGQKQLLCIARVMLTHPPMLILDEATSSIDTRTELKIQDAFEKMMKGKTSFIVAHRLSTVREADLILVMKDGRIIEQGNHEELLEKKGFYFELYYSQFKGV